MNFAPSNYKDNAKQSSPSSNYWFKVKPLPSQYETTIKDYSGSYLFSSVPYLTTPITLNFYQNSIHVSGLSEIVPHDPPPDRKKNDIVSFSKNSRRRMIKLVSTIQFFSYYKTFFVTLTYHEDWNSNPRFSKNHLDRYLKSIKQFLPSIDYIWRLEEQERGAPHYHILFFLREKISTADNKKLNSLFTSAWIKIKDCKCHYCRHYGIDVQSIESTSKLISYVSKYSAKQNENKPASLIGRRWGHSAELLQDAIQVYQFTKSSYRVFYHLLNEQLENEDRDTKYLKSLYRHDNDYFLFINSRSVLSFLNKYFYRFYINTSETINQVFLIDGNGLLI
jgi:hypothetical protein